MLKWQFVSALGVGLVMAVGTTQAATINFTGGGSNWVDPVNWGGNAVTAGNTYVMGSNNTTSVGGTTTFSGDLLVQNGFNATLFTGNNAAFTANLQIINGGRLQRNQTGNSVVSGTILVDSGTGRLWANGGGVRSLEINSLISGDATIDIGGGQIDDGVILTNAANTFSGTWDTFGTGFFRSTVQGSLGTGDIIVDTGIFDAEYNLDATSNSLNMTGGTYELDTFNHTYAENDVVIGTLTLTPGTYDITSLNTLAVVEGLSPTSFTGTTGTLTVIPEPASLVLLGVGSLLMLSRRRQ